MQKEETKNLIKILDEMFPNAGCELNYYDLYSLAVAVMLSAQTTDKKVNMVTPKLFNQFPNLISLCAATEEEIIEIIKPLGLANAKAKNLILFSKKVINDFQGNIPNTLDELITLPGVGRKTANVILSEGFKINRIAVDTHVERTSKRLGLVNMNDNVLEIEKKLMNLFEESSWHHLHHLLIHFGRYFCKAQNPNCNECSFRGICTGYKTQNSNKKIA